jgi:NAD dependent epimerase/dehydratase family enzyme
MRVVLTGATGTIGRPLVSALLAAGDDVVVLARDAGRARAAMPEAVQIHAWPEPTREAPPEAALSGADAVVNLMGEPVVQYRTL